MHAKSPQSCVFVTSWTVALQAPLSMGFYKNTGVGLHVLLQGNFPTQGSNLSLLCFLHCQADSFFATNTTWEVPQFSSVTQLCPSLCDPMNYNMPCLPVHHQLLEFTPSSR